MFAASALRETGRLAGVAFATAATGLLIAALPTAVGGPDGAVSVAAATPAASVQQIDLLSAPPLTAGLPRDLGEAQTISLPRVAGVLASVGPGFAARR